MALALLITFAAFEWETEYTNHIERSYEFDDSEIYIDEIIPIKVRRKSPPPPKPQKITQSINVIPDPFIVINQQPDPAPKPILVRVDPKPEPIYIEKPLPPVLSAEIMPSFPGGDKAMLEYFTQNITYPALARKEGISGLVYLQITINDKGEVVDVIILRGVGAGCDKEAFRVVSNMPIWTPGMQGGKAVAVKLTVPIRFTLL